MFKNIQKYLLLNHPLIWNLRLVPSLIIFCTINLFLLALGYFTTSISFKSTEYFEDIFDNTTMYFTIFILAIICLIIWLIGYFKNNAFNSFYPKKALALYKEWFLTLVIVFSIILFPFSFREGYTLKIRSYVSKSELVEAAKILNRVAILIPNSEYQYYQGSSSTNSFMEDNTDTDSTDENEREQATEEALNTRGKPNHPQLSLLDYNLNNYYIINVDVSDDLAESNIVKSWLVNKDRHRIEDLMQSFLDLQSKHGLTGNLDKDQWMSLIYNPPKYPIGDFNFISHSQVYRDYTAKSYRESQKEKSINYYLSYEELFRSYNKIAKAYNNQNEVINSILIMLYISFAISLLTYSFRITNGRAWRAAFISAGIIILIDILLSLAIFGKEYFPIYFSAILILLFIGYFFYLRTKISLKDSKGKSDIIINQLIWYMLGLPLLVYGITYEISKKTYYSALIPSENDYTFVPDNYLYTKLDNHIHLIMWIILVLSALILYLFNKYFVIKWKGLAEE